MAEQTRVRVRTETGQKRVRVFLGGELVADTRAPLLVWEVPYYPAYYIAASDVAAEATYQDIYANLDEQPDEPAAHGPADACVSRSCLSVPCDACECRGVLAGDCAARRDHRHGAARRHRESRRRDHAAADPLRPHAHCARSAVA